MFKAEGFDKLNVGNYMKFQDGENKVRILDEPIAGFEYWVDANGEIVQRGQRAGEGGKPKRSKTYDDIPMDARGAMKGFAAMKVWNYAVEKIQILQIKQVVIINALQALSVSDDWGDITSFDINITRTKTGPQPMDVEYTVMPSPKTEVSKEILEAYDDTHINLEALYKGEDPFSQDVDPDEVKI